MLNILNINCNTVGTDKDEKVWVATWEKMVSLVQEVSSAVQTQAQKGVVLTQTETEAATQTVAGIQI